METIELNNGIHMPLIGLGTWNLQDEACVDIVSKAIHLGYRLIDTAQMYGNEKEVGLGMKQSGIPRDELFLTTKIYRISNSYEKTKAAIYTSLRNLQVDSIDLLLLHEPYQQGPFMYQALEEAYQKGIVKAIGISNYNVRWYEEFIKNCSILPAVNQVEAHVFFQKWNLQHMMHTHGTAMQAWAPLAQGMEDLSLHPTLVSLGKMYGKTPAQIALRFLVQRGISVIPKSKHSQRLIENIDLFDFELSLQDMRKIRQMDQNKTLFPWTEQF